MWLALGASVPNSERRDDQTIGRIEWGAGQNDGFNGTLLGALAGIPPSLPLTNYKKLDVGMLQMRQAYADTL